MSDYEVHPVAAAVRVILDSDDSGRRVAIRRLRMEMIERRLRNSAERLGLGLGGGSGDGDASAALDWARHELLKQAADLDSGVRDEVVKTLATFDALYPRSAADHGLVSMRNGTNFRTEWGEPIDALVRRLARFGNKASPLWYRRLFASVARSCRINMSQILRIGPFDRMVVYCEYVRRRLLR